MPAVVVLNNGHFVLTVLEVHRGITNITLSMLRFRALHWMAIKGPVLAIYIQKARSKSAFRRLS